MSSNMSAGRTRRWARRQASPSQQHAHTEQSRDMDSCTQMHQATSEMTQLSAANRPDCEDRFLLAEHTNGCNGTGYASSEKKWISAKCLRPWEGADDHEPSLSQKPLALLRDFVGDSPSASSQPPRPVIWDDTRRTFVFHWPKAFSCDKNEEVHHMFQSMLSSADRVDSPWEALTNKSGETTRFTLWWTASDCACHYRYGNASVAASHGSINSLMRRLTRTVMSTLYPKLPHNRWPDSANVNLYKDGSQGVGWHADDEKIFQGLEKENSDVTIISLSLGCTREFWLALKCARESSGKLKPSPEIGSVVELDLADGDVLTMEGLCQKHCVHFVPKGNNASESLPRINVTWRWVRKHSRDCSVSSDMNAGPAFATRRSKFHDVTPRSSPRVELLEWWPGAGRESMSWRKCDQCRHDAWQKGRMCIQGYCRRCWATWSSQDEAAGPLAQKTVTEPCVAGDGQNTGLIGCLKSSLEGQDAQGFAPGVDELRNTIIPAVVDGVKRWAAGAPDHVRINRWTKI